MCPRRLIALNKLTLFIAAAIFFAPLMAFSQAAAVAAPEQQDQQDQQEEAVQGSEAQYISLAGMRAHMAGGIAWDVIAEGTGGGKRLIPNGMIDSRCLQNAQGERATMQLQAHPNPQITNERILFINLTSSCQQAEPNARVVTNTRPRTGRGVVRAPLAAFFQSQDLAIPADFSGTIRVCAITQGDPNSMADRLDSCTQLPLRDIASAGIVNDNRIIGSREVADMARQAAEQRMREQQRAAEAENFAEATRALSTALRAACNGNLQTANMALGRLSSFMNTSELARRISDQAISGLRNEITRAADKETLDAVLDRIESAANSISTADARRLREAYFTRAVALLDAQIADMPRDSGSSTYTSVERDIRELQRQAREILGADARSQVTAIENLTPKLVNRAYNNGNVDSAIEIARHGIERTTGNTQLTYVRAQRQIYERQYRSCVSRAADRAERTQSSADDTRCNRVYQSAQRTQRELVEHARDNGASDSTIERYVDEGREIFGNPGGCSAFGCSQGAVGELMAFRNESLQGLVEGMMWQQQQMRMGMGPRSMYGMNGLNGLNGMQGLYGLDGQGGAARGFQGQMALNPMMAGLNGGGFRGNVGGMFR